MSTVTGDVVPGGEGYGECITFESTGGNCDRGCAAVNGAVGNGERQDDIKRCAAGRHCLELAFGNPLQRYPEDQGVDSVALQVESFQIGELGKDLVRQ